MDWVQTEEEEEEEKEHTLCVLLEELVGCGLAAWGFGWGHCVGLVWLVIIWLSLECERGGDCDGLRLRSGVKSEGEYAVCLFDGWEQ